MSYAALATDYDGTIAHDGQVDEPTLAALERLRAAGWRLILATGRELDDVRSLMPQFGVFDRVVAENGALLFAPATGRVRLLAAPRRLPSRQRWHRLASIPFKLGRWWSRHGHCTRHG